jgi:hypothetical protein
MIENKVKALLFTTILLLVMASCKKIDEFTKFNMDYNTTIVIPSNAIIALPLNILSPDIESNAENEFAVNDTRKDKIEEINLKELKLTITSPPNQQFNFLDSISVSINADGLFETQVAYLYNVPANVQELSLIVNETQDLKEYIKQDKFTLKVRTVTDELITQNINVNVYSKFFVDAKVLGQ